MSKVIRTIENKKTLAPTTQVVIGEPKTNNDLVTLVSTPHVAMVKFAVFSI